MDIGNIEYKGSFQGVNIERYYVANGKRQKENEPALYKNIWGCVIIKFFVTQPLFLYSPIIVWLQAADFR